MLTTRRLVADRSRAGLLLTLVVTAAVAPAAVASPAAATGSGPAAPPGRSCAGGAWFPIHYTASYAGATTAADGIYLRRVPTVGGCASSWAHGDGSLSTSAIAAQCRTGLETRFSYPMTLQFARPVVLENRADCIQVMSAIASGELDPGRAPLFPGGAS